MKIKPEHFKEMSSIINNFLDQNGREKIINDYETGNFPRADKVKDLQTRFVFDLWYNSGAANLINPKIYEYADDTHVLTALKQICPKLNPRQEKAA